MRIPVHSAGWVGIWSSLPFAWSFYITCFPQWAWAVMKLAVIKGKLCMWLFSVSQLPSLSPAVSHHEIWMVQRVAVCSFLGLKSEVKWNWALRVQLDPANLNTPCCPHVSKKQLFLSSNSEIHWLDVVVTKEMTDTECLCPTYSILQNQLWNL